MKRYIICMMLIMGCFLLYGQIRTRTGRQSFRHSFNERNNGGIVNNSARIIVTEGAYIVIAGQGDYQSSGEGHLNNNGTILLSGDFVNNNPENNPLAATGIINFNGTARQNISGNPTAFGNILLNNPQGVNIYCDTSIEGYLTIGETASGIFMTDYDFGVTGRVNGTATVVLNGTGALGNVGDNAQVSLNTIEPAALPQLMNSLIIDVGEDESLMLPNSITVTNLTISSGSILFNDYVLHLAGKDLSISGDAALGGLLAVLREEAGSHNDNFSISKVWNINGSSSGDLNFTLRWQDSENNGNIFNMGTARLWFFDGERWIFFGNYTIVRDGDYNAITFSYMPTEAARGETGDFTITGDNQTLPVELSAFTANVTANGFVKLQWVTESETNMLGYNVYRSQESQQDGALMINSQTIPAKNISGKTVYTFQDEDVTDGTSYYYWLEIIELDLTSCFFGPLFVEVEEQGEEDVTIPQELTTNLIGAYPNPFNPGTYIGFSLAERDKVTITIYNSKGQKVTSLLENAEFDKGRNHSVYWNGKDSRGVDVSSGVYLYIMETGSNYQEMKKMLLVK